MSLEMDVDDGVPFVLFHVHEHPVAKDSGVVDEDVEPAERPDRALDQPRRARELRDVLAVRDRFAAERGDLPHDIVRRAAVGALARKRGTEVVDDHPRTGACERQCVLAADPAAGAGDDRHLPAQIGHVRVRVSRYGLRAHGGAGARP
jgi:hypothetical protein